MKKTASAVLAAILSATAFSASPIARWDGALTDKLPGWTFKASKPNKAGMTYNPFEGYYPDKGGKLTSAVIKLDKAPGTAAYYRIRFTAENKDRSYQGVDFFDAKNNILADNYDVLYAGPKRQYDRVVYAMPNVDTIRVFFQSQTGFRAWDLSVTRATPEEAAEYCDRVYRELPPLKFKAPKNAMDLLPKTKAALKSGRKWKVLMLGDSIQQDTFHSQFHALLKREFPKSDFEFSISMRGSTGCWYYQQADAFKQYVLDWPKPDLLIIGGISNYRKEYRPTGHDAMEIVARAARLHWGCEVLITSATLAVDTRKWDEKNPGAPIRPSVWKYENDDHAKNGLDRSGMGKMVKRANLPFWNLQTPAYTWLYSTGLPHEFYSRDRVHSGEKGKQIIGRIMLEFFKTAK